MQSRLLVIILSAGFFFFFQNVTLAAEKTVIIGYHNNPGISEKAFVRNARGKVKRTFRQIRAMSVRIDEKDISRLKSDRRVAYVENDAVFTAVEPMLGEEYKYAWGVERIGAQVTHSAGHKGAGVKVAVIDSGIDYTHPDLDDNFSGGINFVQKFDGSVDPSDFLDVSTNSHGTHIAGIIAGEENGTGIIGVAPEADLYAVRVLDGAGFGFLSWILSGIDWAVANNMDIINMSLKGMESKSLRDACDAAYDAGVLLVAAAGNSPNDGVWYPAAYDSVVAVTATDINDMQADFSAMGAEIELSAPGTDIYSTVTSGGYDILSGTSQAGAHVSGTAALFMSSGIDDIKDGMIDNSDVRLMLKVTALDLGDTGPDDIFGHGMVNARAAVPDIGEPLVLSLTRTKVSPRHDIVSASLSGGVHEIVIENNGLKKIYASVYEGKTYKSELSSKYRFRRKGPQEVSFPLDSTGTEYDVYFVPIGRPGSSASIVITEMMNTE